MSLDSPFGSPSARAQADGPQANNRSLLEQGIHDVTSVFLGDGNNNAPGKTSVRDEAEHYAAEAITAVPLFMIGTRNAYAASALLYGLNQVHTGSSLGTGLEDFALGATKGVLTKGAFEFVGASQKLNWAAKGVLLGSSARALDVGLSRDTYTGANGQLDLLGGAGKVLSTSLNPTSLGIDVATFGAAHYGLQGLSKLAGKSFLENKLAQNMSMGGIFGFTSGSLQEAQREHAQGESFNLGKVLMRGGIEGGVMSAASIPGGLQMARSVSLSPEQGRSSIPAELAGKDATSRAPSGSEGWRERFSNFGSFLKGNNFGRALGSGDIVGQDGELIRSSALDAKGSGSGEETPPPAGDKGNGSAKPGDKSTRQANGADAGEESDGKPRKPYRTALDILKARGMGDYAEALKDSSRLSSLKASRFIGFGNEVQAAILLPPQKGLPDGGVLKLAHYEGGWNPVWGTRPYDAKVLIDPVDLPHPMGIDVTGYVQEFLQARDSYPSEDTNKFMEKIYNNGDEWSDPGTQPTKQVGYNGRGDLALMDYSAAGKPGENETLQALINGREQARHLEDDVMDMRAYEQEQEEQEERRATADMTDLDTDMELRRQDAVRDVRRPSGERLILEQLFRGESVEDAATMEAVVAYNADPAGDFDAMMKAAKKRVLAVQAKARKEGLLPSARKSSSEQDY